MASKAIPKGSRKKVVDKNGGYGELVGHSILGSDLKAVLNISFTILDLHVSVH